LQTLDFTVVNYPVVCVLVTIDTSRVWHTRVDDSYCDKTHRPRCWTL